MKKSKMRVFICVMFFFAIAVCAVLLMSKESKASVHKVGIETVKESFGRDIQELKEGRYKNLVYHEFESSISAVSDVYCFDILRNLEFEERTFLENFKIMNNVIDQFFMEDFDKSYIVADFHIPDTETIYVDYNDIEEECVDEKYNLPKAEFLFGNNTKNGGYMVQIQESLNNVWFSKFEFGDILPSEYKKTYSYVAGIRQGEDVELNLKDRKIMLSEMEQRVIEYLENDFPLQLSENMELGIGEARLLENGSYDGICFKLRRVYKGIPFEHGSSGVGGMYVDSRENERGELIYAYSTHPDTMLAFGQIDGTVVETEEVKEMISLGTALNLLSERVGKNSIYDIYGIELVYREDKISEERRYEVTDVLFPVWKIITINQNDTHYTLFYVNVVTGEITQRYEYYYE